MKFIQCLTVAFLLGSRTFAFTPFRGAHSTRMNLLMKQESKLGLQLMYTPKTINQKAYVNALTNKNDSITVVVGPAGTGKTLLACNAAINYFKEGKIDKIIITRPVVPVEEDIGFLPGTLAKKMDPWTRPIFDIFEEYYSKAQVANMVLNGQIEISPLGFMRGRTFKHAFIIADEMQNSSPNQMYMLLTRIGINSRMVVTGDLEHSDKLEHNGLKDFIQKYRTMDNTLTKNIALINLDKSDIQRSELVNQIISLYHYKPTITRTVLPIPPVPQPVPQPVQTIVKTSKITYSYIDATKNGDNDAALIPMKHYRRP